MNELRKNTRDWLTASTLGSFTAVLENAKITPRQMEVCRMKFIQGLTNYQITMQTNVSVKTVERDLRTAYNAINNVLLG